MTGDMLLDGRNTMQFTVFESSTKALDTVFRFHQSSRSSVCLFQDSRIGPFEIHATSLDTPTSAFASSPFLHGFSRFH